MAKSGEIFHEPEGGLEQIRIYSHGEKQNLKRNARVPVTGVFLYKS